MVEEVKEVDFVPIAYALLGRKIFGVEKEIIEELLLAVAQEKPDEVVEAFETKSNQKVKYFAAEALGHGILDVSHDGTEVTFAENGDRITYVSKGETPIEAVASHFESKEGKADYHVGQALANKLKRKTDAKVEKEVKASATPTK